MTNSKSKISLQVPVLGTLGAEEWRLKQKDQNVCSINWKASCDIGNLFKELYKNEIYQFTWLIS